MGGMTANGVRYGTLSVSERAASAKADPEWAKPLMGTVRVVTEMCMGCRG